MRARDDTVVQHMTTYWSILERMRGSKLRLTKIDDEIHEHFKKEFPDFDPAATINEDEMKSKAGKEKWRNFIMAYEKRIDDYNFGTMLRASPATEYSEKETIFGECGGERVGWRAMCGLLMFVACLSSGEDAVLCRRDYEEPRWPERLDLREGEPREGEGGG